MQWSCNVKVLFCLVFIDPATRRQVRPALHCANVRPDASPALTRPNVRHEAQAGGLMGPHSWCAARRRAGDASTVRLHAGRAAAATNDGLAKTCTCGLGSQKCNAADECAPDRVKCSARQDSQHAERSNNARAAVDARSRWHIRRPCTSNCDWTAEMAAQSAQQYWLFDGKLVGSKLPAGLCDSNDTLVKCDRSLLRASKQRTSVAAGATASGLCAPSHLGQCALERAQFGLQAALLVLKNRM